MNENKQILHFTIGPVQGFVAQARRTRDLWAGSFLLSWLSGKAMAAVLLDHPENRIVFPDVGDEQNPKDPLLKAILQYGVGSSQIGSLPNRFKAEVPDKFKPEVVRDAVLQAWCDLAEAVREEFVSGIAVQDGKRKEIWDRQIGNFWEITWVMGDDPEDKSDGAWLDARKNWRGQWPSEEGGDHCTVMGDYQELSGYIRSQREEKDGQDAFWKNLQSKVGRLNLRDSERLCAIALVKRLFPKLPEEKLNNTIGWTPGGDVNAVGNWPSTVYMAAVPWLRLIASGEDKISALKAYAETIRQAVGEDYYRKLAGERIVKIKELSPLRNSEYQVGGTSLDSLDGNLFLETTLANAMATPLSDTPPGKNGEDPDKDKREKLLKALQQLNKEVGQSANPFYALLLMDGDRLGELLRKHDATEISSALARFTEKVQDIVSKNNGVTIYAGGDDVLAMLPIDDAITAAIALHNRYQKAFKQYVKFNADDKEDKATLSGAIVYAHYHLPLRSVLEEAHHQLEDIAKERNGRNSLAIALLQSSGRTAEWVSTWCGENGNMPLRLWELAQQFSQQKLFSTRFLYKLRDLFGLAAASGADGEEKTPEWFDEETAKQLLLAEYLDNREQENDKAEAEQRVKALLSICRYHPAPGSYELQRDTPHLLRFLADKGVRP